MKREDRANNNILYFKLSYLPEDGMIKIVSKKVSFSRILVQMQQSNRIREE